MKIYRAKTKTLLILLFPLALIIRELLYLNPSLTEKLYSRSIYPPIGKALSYISGFTALSLAELLVYALIAAVVYSIIRFIYQLFRSKSNLQTFVSAIVNILCLASIVYSLFLLLWGINYYRQPLAYSLDYKVEKSSVSDLKELSAALIDKTNRLRAEVKENEAGIMYIGSSFESTASRAEAGYENLSAVYPFFRGPYGKPKGVTFSRLLAYTGIAGFYFPYTGEANVNKLVPDSMLPSTITHEMAHQRGFAREDEANFLAYLAGKANNDADFQYSGYLLATVYTMNALYEYDIEGYRELTARYSDGLRRDLEYNSDFWRKFEGPAEKLQEKLNDAYLKTNKQPDGINSYGRMVDLLLAEFKKNKHL